VVIEHARNLLVMLNGKGVEWEVLDGKDDGRPGIESKSGGAVREAAPGFASVLRAGDLFR